MVTYITRTGPLAPTSRVGARARPGRLSVIPTGPSTAREWTNPSPSATPFVGLSTAANIGLGRSTLDRTLIHHFPSSHVVRDIPTFVFTLPATSSSTQSSSVSIFPTPANRYRQGSSGVGHPIILPIGRFPRSFIDSRRARVTSRRIRQEKEAAGSAVMCGMRKEEAEVQSGDTLSTLRVEKGARAMRTLREEYLARGSDDNGGQEGVGEGSQGRKGHGRRNTRARRSGGRGVDSAASAVNGG